MILLLTAIWFIPPHDFKHEHDSYLKLFFAFPLTWSECANVFFYNSGCYCFTERKNSHVR